MSVTLQKDKSVSAISDNLAELKNMLSRIRSMEQEASLLISKIEKNKE
jgi:hypothetical protein